MLTAKRNNNNNKQQKMGNHKSKSRFNEQNRHKAAPTDAAAIAHDQLGQEIYLYEYLCWPGPSLTLWLLHRRWRRSLPPLAFPMICYALSMEQPDRQTDGRTDKQPGRQSGSSRWMRINLNTRLVLDYNSAFYYASLSMGAPLEKQDAD